jgi:hypothetical protein
LFQFSGVIIPNTTGNLAVNDRTTEAAVDDPLSVPSGATSWRADGEGGIDVREEDLAVIRAQPLYRMRCECGRSWFELVLKTLVECPACHKLGLVSQYPDPPPQEEGTAIAVPGPSTKSGRVKRASRRL